MPLAAGHHVAAALLGVGDKTFHGIDAACVRHRPHGDALFQTVAELDAFRIIGEARDEFLVGVLLHVEAAWRDADLAGVAVLERSDRVGGLLRVGIGEHHHGRMATQFHGRALHALGGERSKMLADRDRPGEGNLSYRILGEKMLGNLRRYAEHEIEHARRQRRVDKAAYHFDASARRLLRRLEDQRAARRERAADLARGREHGEIPRRERRYDADRLVHHQLARALRAAGHDAPVAAAPLLGVPVDDVGGGEHLGARLGVDLALLLHHHLGDRVVALAHEVRGFAHDFRAVVGGGSAPERKAFLGGFERLVEIGLGRVRQMRERLLGRRIDDVLALAAATAVDPFAVDVKREIGIHGAPRTFGTDDRCVGISTFSSRIHPLPLVCCHSGRATREPESSNPQRGCSSSQVQ